MKFILWTLFLSIAAIFVVAIWVSVLAGYEYQLESDTDNPRNQGRRDMTIDRENTGAILFIGVLGVVFSIGALRNWRSILTPTE